MARILRAVKPNAGLRAEYRRDLERMVEEMRRSVLYWMRAEYQRQAARAAFAQDASPAAELAERLRKLMRGWIAKWDLFAERVAARFVRRVARKTVNSMKRGFADAGLTVSMNPTRLAHNTVRALTIENVGLIKSIPRDFHNAVLGVVERGMSLGRDVAQMTAELEKSCGVARRRAALIARDQANKCTEAIKRVYDQEAGVTEGVWVHVPGVHTSRVTHRAMNGKRFKLAEGLYDSAVDRKVLPGELVACACTYRPVIPEFGDKR